MSDADPLRGDLAESGYEPARYVLSAVVYAERSDEILLLKRAAGSALAGQWFLPGGLVEPGELPEEGARRELREEAGVEIDGDLEIIGCYPMHVYGYDTLQISYRGPVADGADVVVSHEHGELPEEGARRELREEAGVEIEGELEIIGCYPMHVYGYDTLQISYRGPVADGADVVVSHEHDGARWAKATDMRALLTDEVIQQISAGREQVVTLLGHVRIDLDRYLARADP